MGGVCGFTCCTTWPHRWHLARETHRLSWALKIYSTSLSKEWDCTMGQLSKVGLSAGCGSSPGHCLMKEGRKATMLREFSSKGGT